MCFFNPHSADLCCCEMDRLTRDVSWREKGIMYFFRVDSAVYCHYECRYLPIIVLLEVGKYVVYHYFLAQVLNE